jgi:hypothetical protein
LAVLRFLLKALSLLTLSFSVSVRFANYLFLGTL